MGAGSAGAVVLCTTIMLGLVCAIPIAMICLGALHIDECHMQPWIPIFMIVAGAVGILHLLLAMCLNGAKSAEKSTLALCVGILFAVVALFTFAWNIAGSVWGFKKWSTWDDVKDKPKQGCYNDLYLFAFAYLIIFWITCPCMSGGAAKQQTSDA